MSLLSVEHVTKRHGQGRIERVVLSGVSLRVEPGQMVAVWGMRRSGRTTLARVAAGLEFPDEGTVLFAGRDLARCRDDILGSGLGYVHLDFCAEGGSVLEHVESGLLAKKGLSLSAARRSAQEVLAEVGAEDCAELGPRDLDAGESVRVALARALVSSPELLIVDEPTNGVDLLDRDPILMLLHRVVNRGVAVLMTTGDGATLAGVDRVFTLAHGELCGGVSSPPATVSQLRRPSSWMSTGSGRVG